LETPFSYLNSHLQAFGFTLQTPGRLFILHATCHSEKNAWIAAFQQKCPNAVYLDPAHKPGDAPSGQPSTPRSQDDLDRPPADAPPIPMAYHPQPTPQRESDIDMSSTVRISIVHDIDAIEPDDEGQSPFETYKSK
jgi:hypothetical protein